MKIALAQIPVLSGDAVSNFKKMSHYILCAAEEGAQVVIFPEMCDVGYDLPNIKNYCLDWHNELLPELCKLASQFNINVVAGVAEKQNDRIYNTLVVASSHGTVLGTYRKTHLITAAPIHEERYIEPGNELLVVKINNVNFGLLTCYEIRFPEIARALTQAGAQVLVTPAAFPLSRLDHWDKLAYARAIENQVFFAAISRIGSDMPGGALYSGNSKILSPYGKTLAHASTAHECLLTAELDLAEITRIRSEVKVHQDLRPDLYRQTVKVLG